MRGRIAEWFWQWRLKLAGHPLTQPGCGRCGYPVHGLTSTICPECGADHRIVGIAHPPLPLSNKMRRRLYCLIWCLVIVALAFALNPLLLPLTPRDLSNHRDYSIKPHSPAYRLNVRQIGYGWGWRASPWIPQSPHTVVITLHPSVGSDLTHYFGEISIHASGPAAAYACRFDPGVAQSQKVYESNAPFTRDMLQYWFRSMDADMPEAQFQELISDLYLLATPRRLADPPPSLNCLQVAAISGGPEIAAAYHGQPWAITFWLVIWLIGYVALRYRFRGHPLIAPQRDHDHATP